MHLLIRPFLQIVLIMIARSAIVHGSFILLFSLAIIKDISFNAVIAPLTPLFPIVL